MKASIKSSVVCVVLKLKRKSKEVKKKRKRSPRYEIEKKHQLEADALIEIEGMFANSEKGNGADT